MKRFLWSVGMVILLPGVGLVFAAVLLVVCLHEAACGRRTGRRAGWKANPNETNPNAIREVLNQKQNDPEAQAPGSRFDRFA